MDTDYMRVVDLITQVIIIAHKKQTENIEALQKCLVYMEDRLNSRLKVIEDDIKVLEKTVERIKSSDNTPSVK